MKAEDIEIAVAKYLNYRQNFIVPNVSWGLGFRHELDLAVVTKSGYLWEVEIKISKSDLKADQKKWHNHADSRISRLYFAIPEELEGCIDLVPECAGIFSVRKRVQKSDGTYAAFSGVKKIREAKRNREAEPITDKEIRKLYHLSSMRIWGLKQRLINSDSFQGDIP